MTSRQPARKLSDVLVKSTAAVRKREQQSYTAAKLRSTRTFRNGHGMDPSRSHAEVFVSPHGIAPLRSEAWEGYWFLHKPAFVPVAAAAPEQPPLAPGKPVVAGEGPSWSIDRYLNEAPLVNATFDKAESLTVLHDLATPASGLLPIAVGLPAELAADRDAVQSYGLVAAQKYELLVWGHLRRSIRPELLDGLSLKDFVAPASVAAAKDVESSGPLPALPPSAIAAWVPAVGYYCGQPASVLVLRIASPDLRLIGSVNWSELAAAAGKHFTVDSDQGKAVLTTPTAPTAGTLRPLPPPTDAAGRPLLVGDSATDTFGKELKLGVPRLMVNLNAVTVRPIDAGKPSFEANETPRFAKLLSLRPPLADPASAIASRRRRIV